MSHNQYAQASGTELCHFLRDAVAAVRLPLGQVSLVFGWRSAYETLSYVSQSVPKVTRTIANDLLSLCWQFDESSSAEELLEGNVGEELFGRKTPKIDDGEDLRGPTSDSNTSEQVRAFDVSYSQNHRLTDVKRFDHLRTAGSGRSRVHEQCLHLFFGKPSWPS